MNTDAPTALPRRAILGTLVVLGLAAAGVSAYMLWLGQDAAAGCGGSDAFDCESVLASRWAQWLRLPVSLPALLLYLAIAAAALVLLVVDAASDMAGRATFVLTAGALLAGAAALWFVGLQLFALPGLCPYCLVVHACGLSVAGLALVLALLDRPRLPIASPAIMAVAGWASLVAGQTLVTPPSIQVQTVDALAGAAEDLPAADAADSAARESNESHATDEGPATADAKSSNAFDAGNNAGSALPRQKPAESIDISFLSESQQSPGDEGEKKSNDASKSPIEISAANKVRAEDGTDAELTISAPAAEDGLLELFDGKVKIKLADVIVLGNPKAPHLVVEMFDYTCHHCRALHWRMEEVRKRYGKQLAIVMLPVPLNSGCNPSVKETSDGHENACVLARLAVAVWQKRPSKFEEFHSRLMGGVDAPEPGQMRYEAGRLMTPDELEATLLGDTVDAQLKIGTELYRIVKAGKIPKLIFGGSIAVGAFDNTDELFELFEGRLGLRPVENP